MKEEPVPTDTLYIGGLDQRVSKRIIWDLCLQAGPVKRVHIPLEPDGTHKGFAFCEFTSVESAVYAKQLFQDLVCLFGRQLRINFSHQGNKGT